MFTKRKANSQDIPLIRSIARVAFYDTYGEILSSDQLDYMYDWMYSEDSLLQQLKDGHVFYLGFCEGEAFGYVSVQQERGDLFHLQKIYLLPSMQGTGGGRFLFETAVAHVRALSSCPCVMELNVNRMNKARAFYEHMGMRVVRQGDFSIGGGYYMNDYIMSMFIE